MQLGNWICHLTDEGIAVSELQERFADAAVRAARQTFPDHSRFYAEVSESGEIFLYQENRVVQSPQNNQEISYPLLQKLVKTALADDNNIPLIELFVEMAKTELDEDLCTPLFWTVPGERTAKKFDAALPGLLPLPSYHMDLWEALEIACTEVIRDYRPAKPFKPGTGGNLIQSGGWLLGLEGESKNKNVKIRVVALHESTIATFSVHFFTQILKLHLEAEYNGEIFKTVVKLNDQDTNLRPWLEIPLSEKSKPGVIEVLSDFAEELEQYLAADQSLKNWNSYRAIEKLLIAAQPDSAEDSLAIWVLDELFPRLEEAAVAPPGMQIAHPVGGLCERAKWYRGSGWMEFDLYHDGKLIEASISLGSLSERAFEAGTAPGENFDQLISDWPERWWKHFAASVKWGLERGEMVDTYWFSQVCPSLELFEAIEQSIEHGPPGPPPVPPPDKTTLKNFAKNLALPDHEDSERVIKIMGRATAAAQVVLRAGSWLILLRDHREGHPHGASFISVWPDGGELVDVQTTDVWNPPAKFCVDGDAFAFRRFVDILRGALLLRPELDQNFSYSIDVDDLFDEDEEDLEASKDGYVKRQVRASEWLLFNEPILDDDLILDWRTQSHIVSSTSTILDTAGMYGFDPKTTQGLKGGDYAAVWRRFLVEVVDERF